MCCLQMSSAQPPACVACATKLPKKIRTGVHAQTKKGSAHKAGRAVTICAPRPRDRKSPLHRNPAAPSGGLPPSQHPWATLAVEQVAAVEQAAEAQLAAAARQAVADRQLATAKQAVAARLTALTKQAAAAEEAATAKRAPEAQQAVGLEQVAAVSQTDKSEETAVTARRICINDLLRVDDN
jgi:hypothetical protein